MRSFVLLAVLSASPGCSGLISGETGADDLGGDGDGDGDGGGGGGSDGGGADGCPFAPGQAQKQAFFTTTYPDADPTIEDQLVSLIDATVDGGRIRLSIYTWTRTRISDALLAAAARGVDVAIITDEINQHEDPPGSDNWGMNTPLLDLSAGLGADRTILCDDDAPPDGGACHGPGINHNKLALFSELCDGLRDVVVQSSANYTSRQREARNNMVVVRDDPALYAAYDAYWADLATRKKDPSYYRSFEGSTGTKAYFYPRAPSGEDSIDPASDTVQGVLDHVDCGPNGRVRVAMAIWTDARIYLVDALAAAAGRGCDVRVLVGSKVEAAVEDRLRDRLGDRVRFVSGLHSKYLVVDGLYKGAEESLLWTGSHNFTGAALRSNDETLLKVDDAEVHAAFSADWRDAWERLPDRVSARLTRDLDDPAARVELDLDE